MVLSTFPLIQKLFQPFSAISPDQKIFTACISRDRIATQRNSEVTMNIFWYEVNEAWSEASLVWLWSFIKACKRSDSRIDVGLEIWCEEGEWVNGYRRKVAEIIDGWIEYNVREFNFDDVPDIELEGRCIDSRSVKIAVSRIWHYNEMVRENSISVVGVNEINYSYNERVRLIHCDIDGVFTERFDLGRFLGEVQEVPRGCIGGCNEYDDIAEGLSETHTSDFMEKLDHTYLNCGMMVFNVGVINVSELIEYISNAFCLEQDYVNERYTKYCIDERYNYTFRKKKRLDTIHEFMLPYFVHFYGDAKPFKRNEVLPLDREIYEYWGEYFRNVVEIQGVLTDEFYSLCRENYVVSCRY